MPSVRRVDCSDGFLIEGSCGLPLFRMTEIEIRGQGEPDLDKLSAALTMLAQMEYETSVRLDSICDIDPEDPVCQDPPVLLVNERIERIKGRYYLITTNMWVAVRVLELTEEILRCTVKTQNPEAGPITGEWWL